jgi:hypothetical protein
VLVVPTRGYTLAVGRGQVMIKPTTASDYAPVIRMPLECAGANLERFAKPWTAPVSETSEWGVNREWIIEHVPGDIERYDGKLGDAFSRMPLRMLLPTLLRASRAQHHPRERCDQTTAYARRCQFSE